MAISMLKIRRPLGRLIFNMGIAIPGKTVFLIETAPWWHQAIAWINVNLSAKVSFIWEQGGIHLRAVLQEVFMISILNFCVVYEKYNSVSRGPMS